MVFVTLAAKHRVAHLRTFLQNMHVHASMAAQLSLGSVARFTDMCCAASCFILMVTGAYSSTPQEISSYVALTGTQAARKLRRLMSCTVFKYNQDSVARMPVVPHVQQKAQYDDVSAAVL